MANPVNTEPDRLQSSKFRLGYVLTVGFAHLLHDIYSSFLSPILPIIIKNLRISLTLAALLSVFQRIPALINPFIGSIADRMPVLYFIVLAPVVTAFTMSILPAVNSYFLLVVLLLLMGISASLFHVPAPVLMRRVSGNRVGTGMSFYMLGGEAARAIGPIIILGAISLWGTRGTYRLAIFALVAALMIFYVLKDTPGSKRYHFDGVNRERKKSSVLLIVLKRHRRLFLVIAGLSFSKSVISSSLSSFLPTYLNFKGENLWFAGISLSVLEFAGAAGTFLSGVISDRIGRKKMLLVSAVLSPFFMLAFLLSRGVFIFPSLLLLGFVLFSTSPVLLALVQESEKEYPSSANGFYMMFNFVINSIVIIGVGLLGDRIGLENTYRISFLLSLVGIPLVIIL